MPTVPALRAVLGLALAALTFAGSLEASPAVPAKPCAGAACLCEGPTGDHPASLSLLSMRHRGKARRRHMLDSSAARLTADRVCLARLNEAVAEIPPAAAIPDSADLSPSERPPAAS